MLSSQIAQFQSQGFTIVDSMIDEATLANVRTEVEQLRANATGATYAGIRHLLTRSPVIRDLACCQQVRRIVNPILGEDAFCVKALFFDKSEATNWWVGWHQDQFITVREKQDVTGYHGFWKKEGVLHVKPPADVLARMLTMRIHLDDCTINHGPLEVIPQSHQWGFVSDETTAEHARKMEVVTLTASSGSAILMRPLILHSSRKMTVPGQRRVIHFEYAAENLPSKLEWNERVK